MSEEMDENEVEMEAEFEPQDVYNFMDCLIVIDTLAAHSLKWVQKLGTVSTPSLLAIQRHLRGISVHVKKMQWRMLEHTQEVMGRPHVAQTRRRHGILWVVIKRVLRGMRFF